MRVPDTNVLIYAVNADAPQHRLARAWLEQRLSGTETVGWAWIVLLGFLRLATSRAVFPAPLDPEAALDQLDQWLRVPVGTVVDPTDRHPAVLRGLLEGSGTAGNLTTDAHLATIAIEHRATLTSFDGDFHRFNGLELEHLR